jgi:Domain of unknown function (DUF1330)
LPRQEATEHICSSKREMTDDRLFRRNSRIDQQSTGDEEVRREVGSPIEGAVILAFPTFEEAEAWYDSPAYQDAVQHRFRGAKYQTFIIQGV